MLYLISTPIGNLADFTFRAVTVLQTVDYILCEDTRKSCILLNHYQIKKPLKSFHKFNEKSLENAIVLDLQQGKNIALLSDAGTPLICDPGQSLVSRCHLENLPFTCLPGASAPLLALVLAGFNCERFQFLGFVPKVFSERKNLLIEAFTYSGISLFFESPHRIKQTLQDIEDLGFTEELAIARELTKLYEECSKGTAKELKNKEFRGEIVMILPGSSQESFTLTLEEHVCFLQEKFHLSKKEAIQTAAKLRNTSKKQVYSCLISNKEL